MAQVEAEVAIVDGDCGGGNLHSARGVPRRLADTIRIWINSNLNVAPLDGAADITLNANDFNPTLAINRDLIFNRFRIFGGGTNAVVGYGSIEMDEIRIGEGFGDVTPYTAVPEPAIAALGGLGVLAMILRRRRS